jgi:hypothetical protein
MIQYLHSAVNADNLATSTDQYQQPNSFSVNTDAVYFIINNSANSGICNIKSMFVGDFERHRVTLVTAYGRTTTMKLVRAIRLVLKDYKDKTWSYDIPDIVYDPESPYSLLTGSHPSWRNFLLYCNISKLY